MFSPLAQTRGVHFPAHGITVAASPSASYRSHSVTAVPATQARGQLRPQYASAHAPAAVAHPSVPTATVQVPGTPVADQCLAKSRRSAATAPPMASPVAHMRTPSLDHRQVVVAMEPAAAGSGHVPPGSGQLAATASRLQQQSPRAAPGDGRWLPPTPQVECRPSPLVQYRTVASHMPGAAGNSLTATVGDGYVKAMASLAPAPAQSSCTGTAQHQLLQSPVQVARTVAIITPVTLAPASAPAAGCSGSVSAASGGGLGSTQRTPAVPSWAVAPHPCSRQASGRALQHPLSGKQLVLVTVANSWMSRGHGTPGFPRHYLEPQAAHFPPAASSEEAIHNTASMLPPSPGNTLAAFLSDVLRGDVDPALCCSEPKIDPQRYWETRRVQNSVRRLLECLQDLLRLEAGTPACEVANAVWEAFFFEYLAVDEQVFVSVLDHISAWPPEMSHADRVEVFAALRVPSAASLRALVTGQPLALQVSARMLGEALSRLPFNIPDFPVPSHLYHPQFARLTVEQVAALIACAFSREVQCLDRSKDYYMTGLLSLEQIQAGLPCTVKDSLLELAVAQVIRVGTSMFSNHEWHMLVLSIRLSPIDPNEAADPERARRQQERYQLLQQQHEFEQQQLLQQLILKESQLAAQERRKQQHQMLFIPPSPAPTPAREMHRDVRMVGSPVLQTRQVDCGLGASAAVAAGSCRPGEDSPPHRPRRQTVPSQSPNLGVPMTEPLPHRSVHLAEQPVVFTETFSKSGKLAHIINWDSSRPAAAADATAGVEPSLLPPLEGSPVREGDVSAQTDLGHQADEGAGSRTAEALSLQGCSSLEEQCATEPAETEGGRVDDAVRFISLDMHNECLGPFLALAFVRCCQLYEAQLSELEAPAA